MIVAVDGGRSYYKVATENGIKTRFQSLVTPYYKTDWDCLNTEDDTVIEYEGEKYYVGPIVDVVGDADRGRRFHDDKAGKHTLLLTLRALWKIGANEFDPVDLVTCVPLDRFNEDKEKMKQLLIGENGGIHHFKITNCNGTEHRTVRIRNVAVTVEGAGAFFDQPEPGEVRVFMFGSRKSTAITFRNKRYIPPESQSLPWGWDTLLKQNRTHKYVAEAFAGEMSKKWPADSKLLVVGGQADKGLTDAIQEYYRNAYTVGDPQMADARGMVKIGMVKFR